VLASPNSPNRPQGAGFSSWCNLNRNAPCEGAFFTEEKLRRSFDRKTVTVPLQERVDELQALADQGAAVIGRDHKSGKIEAFAAALPSGHPDWYELSYWVDPAKTDDISVVALLHQLMSKRPSEQRYFLISREQQVVDAARHGGFTLIERGVKPGDFEPIYWAYRTKTVCRLPISVHRPVDLHNKTEERLLVR